MDETPDTAAQLTETLEHQVHDGHSDVFPPFDREHFASQILWLAISFGLLYYLVSKVALPRVAGILEDRHDRIAWDLSEAERLKQESDDAVAPYETALAEAREKAHGIARGTDDKLAADVSAKRAAVEADLTAKLVEAEQRIAAIKTEAMAEVGGIAAEATRAIVEAMVPAEVSREEIDGAVAAARGA